MKAQPLTVSDNETVGKSEYINHTEYWKFVGQNCIMTKMVLQRIENLLK